MLFSGLYKHAGWRTGLSAGIPTAVASYFLSGLFDKEDKHQLARVIGSILLGAGVGFGAHKFFSKPIKGKIKVLKETDSDTGADI